MNITGLRICTCGASFLKVSSSARFMISGSNNQRSACLPSAVTSGAGSVTSGSTNKCAAVLSDIASPFKISQAGCLGRARHIQMLHDGTQGECRKEGQRAHHEHDPNEPGDEERSMGRQRPHSGCCAFFCRQRPRDRQYCHEWPEPPKPHGEPQRCVIERRIGGEPSEGAAVVVARGGKGIE